MLLARSINPSAPSFFHAGLSPHAKSHKGQVDGGKCLYANHGLYQNLGFATNVSLKLGPVDTVPKKLEWTLTPELRIGFRYAETRISDLICQNDCRALEFKGYGRVGCYVWPWNRVHRLLEFHHSSWI